MKFRYRMVRALWFALLISGSTGCYTFRTGDSADLRQGQDVRIRVTGAYADSLAPVLMRGDARELEGTLASEDSSAVMLEVPVASELQGMQREALHQRVEIPREALVDVEVKQFSRARTTVALVGLVGAATVIVVSQFSGDSGGAQQPGPGRPAESVVSIPILSWPLTVLGSLFSH